MLSRIARASQLPRRAAGVPIRLSTQLASAPSTSAVDALNAPLSQTDPELFDIIEHEKKRQRKEAKREDDRRHKEAALDVERARAARAAALALAAHAKDLDQPLADLSERAEARGVPLR